MSQIIFAVIDVETTAIEPPEAEVIEIGRWDLLFDTETKEMSLEFDDQASRLFGASKPLSPENIAIHHIRDSDIQDLERCSFDRIVFAATRRDPFALVAHNAAYEKKFFTPRELGDPHFICTMKCARRAWPDAPSHGNQALKYFLGLHDLPHELCMPPHRAAPDAYVTAHILGRLLQEYSVMQLVEWSNAPLFYPTCPLAKYRGQKWENIPADYLQWIAFKPNELEEDLKAAARDELERRRTSR